MLLDKETFEAFGYKATSLSKGSNKPVVVRCPLCQETRTQKRNNMNNSSGQCIRCSRTNIGKRKRDLAPLRTIDSSISIKGTVVTFGYDPRTLSPKSSLPVVFICPGCKDVLHRRFYLVNANARCIRCSAAWRTERAVKGFENKSIPEGLDETATIARFGYSILSLTPSSLKKVVCRCITCGAVRILTKSQAKPRCTKCSHKKTWKENGSKYLAVRLQTIRLKYGDKGLPGKKNYTEYRKIGEAISGWGFVIGLNVRKLDGKDIDILIPSKNVGIEYNGLNWHHELSLSPRGRTYHFDKWSKAKELGIHLLTVWEDEWLQRRHAVEGVLKAALSFYDVKIGARKCDLQAISLEEARMFMNREHLQGGSRRAIKAWGLCHENRLVGAVTLATHHRHTNQKVLVLDRLCFANGISVVGGSARLLKPLVVEAKALGALKLISWSDNRWAKGDVYPALGFRKEEDLAPDYCYVSVKAPKERLSKQSQRKKATACPSHLTEVEWAHERGLARMWDCGRVRWVMDL
jgi:hypothetical protein